MEEREGLIKIKDWNSQYILESQLPYFVVLCAKQEGGLCEVTEANLTVDWILYTCLAYDNMAFGKFTELCCSSKCWYM